MADSKEKPTQTEPENPSGSTSLMVTNQHGAVHEIVKDGKSGKFLAKKKPLLPTIEFTRKERKILNTPREQGDKKGMAEHEISFRNILRISQIETTDAKEMMAVVKAYEIVMRRALGKEATSEQDLDRMEKQAITGYFIQAPALPNPAVEDGDKPKDKPTQPSFAEVIGVVTNEKK
jgi:hypothetical protein